MCAKLVQLLTHVCQSGRVSLPNGEARAQAFFSLSLQCRIDILTKVDVLGLNCAVCISCIALHPGLGSILPKTMQASQEQQHAHLVLQVQVHTQSSESF